MTTRLSSDTIWNPVFTFVFISNTFKYLGIHMVNTLISKYADALGASATIVGGVSSIFAASALAFKVFSGPAIDSFNRKIVLIAASSVVLLSYIGYSLSVNVQMLFAFRFLQGCGQAFTATCGLALAADSLPGDKLGAGLGTFILAQSVCQAIGPSASLYLAGLFGYSIAFAITTLCMVFSIVSAIFIKPPERERSVFKITLKGFAAREAILPSVLIFFLQMTFCTINAFLVIYAESRGVMNIGSFYTVYAITMIFIPRLVGRLVTRWGTIKAALPAMACFAIAFLLISLSKTLPFFLLSATVSACGYGAAQPAIQALSMKSVPPSRRGAASSTSYIGLDLGNLIGPVAAGAIVVRLGYAAMWRIMIVPVGFAVVTALLFQKRLSRIEEGQHYLTSA